ncbi:MAG: hypothetical protein MJ053_07340, partial [Elusimicrobiaceae bacterium]|nr:hypothetical protein [Elusimicrobiaceae bacterium]
MAEDDTKRTLIALGAFSQVVGGGGGDIPEDLTLHSLTACIITGGEFNACDIRVNGTIYANGPIALQDCAAGVDTVYLANSNGDLVANGDLVHTVGTRPLAANTLMRGGRYYYLNTDEATCRDFSSVQVHCNET